MYKAVVFLLIVSIVMGDEYGGDLDAIIEDIFRANSSDIDANTARITRDTSTEAVGNSNSSTPVAEEAPKCSLADGTEGRCVVYYSCDKQDNSQYKDGIIDIGLGSDNECENYLDVCCPLK